jgi:hypothetical protein
MKPPLDTAVYLLDLADAYLGEFHGIALFTELKDRMGIDDDKRTKVVHLINLERRTAQELEPLIVRYRLGPFDFAAADAAGRAWADRAESWDGMLQMLLNDVPAYVAAYDAMLESGPIADRSELTFLAAHERALLAFLECETGRRRGDSLFEVHRLLQQ